MDNICKSWYIIYRPPIMVIGGIGYMIIDIGANIFVPMSMYMIDVN